MIVSCLPQNTEHDSHPIPVFYELRLETTYPEAEFNREGLSCWFLQSGSLDMQLEELVIAEPSALNYLS